MFPWILYGALAATEPDGETEETVPKGKFDELVTQRNSLKTQLRETKEKVDTLELNAFSDDDKALFETLKKEREEKETNRAKEAGEYDELLKKEREKADERYDGLKTESDATIAKQQTFIDRLLRDNGIQLALAAEGITDAKKVEQITLILRDSIRVIDTETGYGLECLDADGMVKENDRREPITIPDHVSDLLKDAPYFRENGTGAGPRLGSRITSDGNRRANYIERSPSENLEGLYKEN